MKKIYFYPGRFQPMGPHHAEVFFKIMLDHDDENLGPFIVTSDKTELPKSPLSFEEKKQVMMAHGISSDRIIKVKNPYYVKEILFDYEPSEVEAIYLVGAKDMAEDPRFKKTEGTTKEGYKWSIEVAPHVEKDVEGEEMSGTTLRKTLANADKETFYSIMGFEDEKIYNLLTQKFSQIEEDFYDPRNKTVDFMRSSEYKAGMPDGSKDDIPRFGDRIHNRQKSPVSWEENLKENKGGKVLRVYDFDDTLAITKGANIKVKHEDGSIDILDPAEFAVYDGEPGDKFDFTEFDKEIKEAEPIQNIIYMLKQDLDTTAKVTILTARLLAYPVRRYLKTLNLDAYVVAVGSSDPNDKAKWIENHIEKGYNDILFIDDSEKNRNAVANLKDKYPDITLDVQDPANLSEMMGTMNKQEMRKHKNMLKKMRKSFKKYNKKNKYFKVPKSWKGTLTRKYKRKKRKLKENNAIINDLSIPLEIMDTPKMQAQGMIGRNNLEGGMLFPYSKPEKRSFHMKGCKIPLDIIFITNGSINHIEHNCPPCQSNNCPQYKGIGDNILELPGGFCEEKEINIGDKIQLSLTEQKLYNSFKDKPLNRFVTACRCSTLDKFGNCPRGFIENGEAYFLDCTIDGNTPKVGDTFTYPTHNGVGGWKVKVHKVKIATPHPLGNYHEAFSTVCGEGHSSLEENVFTKSWWKKLIKEQILITEGGAAGHMNHPFDDRELTFSQMKELVKLSLQGQLDIEADVTEKTDGQNLAVTYKDGNVGAARNKATLRDPMSIDDVAKKFEGRGDIEKAFTHSMRDLENALKELDEDILNDVFRNGTRFLNLEIIYPATKNVITYGSQAYLQFHGLDEYDLEAAKKINSLGVPEELKKITQDVNARTQDTFEIIPPKIVQTQEVPDFDEKESYYIDQINQLQQEFDLSDDDPVLTYHEKWWEQNIDELFPEVTEEEKDALVRRWASFKKDFPLRKIIDKETSAKVIEYDKQDFKQVNKQNVYQFEKIFLELGVDVLANIDGFLAANPNESVQELRKDVQNVQKQIEDSGDLDVLKKLEYQLKRIEDIGGFDKLVPSEGIVFIYKGKTYKLTGLFAPVNQLLGLTKYV